MLDPCEDMARIIPFSSMLLIAADCSDVNCAPAPQVAVAYRSTAVCDEQPLAPVAGGGGEGVRAGRRGPGDGGATDIEATDAAGSLSGCECDESYVERTHERAMRCACVCMATPCECSCA